MKLLSFSAADGQIRCHRNYLSCRSCHGRSRSRQSRVADRHSCCLQRSSSSSSLPSLSLLKKLLFTVLFVATTCTTSIVSSLSLHHPQKHQENNNINNNNKNNISSRRKVLIQTINSVGTSSVATALVVGGGIGSGFVASTNPASASPTATDSSNEDRIQLLLGQGQGPISIIGANGRTGSLCVTACLRRGIPVKALTRTGIWQPPENQKEEFKLYDQSLLSIVQCDVTKAKAIAVIGGGGGGGSNNSNSDNDNNNNDDETTESIINQIRTAIQGSSSVIYAASSSKKGGSPYLVDNKGVVNTAKACIEENISKYIVISSTATTRPKSLGYIFTNLSVGGNIMGEKRKGELGVIESYNKLLVASSSTSTSTSTSSLSSTPTSSLPSFVIVRPGGLEEPKRNSILGPTALEVSQGDVLAGVISRADLAEFTIETALLLSPPANNNNNRTQRNTAIELYYTSSVVPSESKFKKQFLRSSTTTNMNADIKQEDELPPTRLHGSSYGTLLEGVKSNIDFY